MTWRHGFILAALAAAILTPGTGPHARGAEPSGREIAERMQNAHRSDAEIGVFEMRITDAKGKEKVRSLKAWSLTPKGQPEKGMMRFLDPPDVKGTAVLTLEQPGKEDEQWLYLPALKRTRRIAGSQKSESFMGSDLSYDDLRPIDLDAYAYTVLRSEKLADGECWVLEARPVKGGKAADSAYARTLTWVRKADAVPLKGEMYDAADAVVKAIAYQGYEARDGLQRPGAILVENRKKGSKTTIRYGERQINPKLDGAIFTTRALETEGL